MSSLPRPLTIAAGFFLLHSGLAVAQTQLVGAYHLEHADAGTVIYGDDAARLKLGRRTDASAQWVLESTGVEHHYRLRHTATGQLLTQQSTSVELQPDHPARAQLFKLDEPEPGMYRLTSTVSGQSLDASTGSLRFSTHGSTLLPWKLIPVGAWRGLDGQAVVTSTLSDKVLDVAGQEAGAPVVQWTYEKARNQHWTVVDAGTGYYRFQASHSDLLLRGMPSASPGQTLHQAAYRGDSDELFAILGTSDQVTLRHKSSGQLVSLPDWSVSNGTPLQLEPASPGATHQAFRLSRPATRSIAQSTSAASGGNVATPSPDESASAASVAAGPVFEERFDGLKTGLPWLNMNDTLIKAGCGVGKTHCLRVSYVPNNLGTPRIGALIPIAPAKEYTLNYDLYFESGFEFVKGGKLPGLAPVNPVSGCNAKSPDQWSARLMWGRYGQVRPYVYHQDQSSRCGEGPEVKKFNFKTGRWYALSLRIKVNSAADKHDGIVELYIDGVRQASHTGVRLRGEINVDTEINRLFFATFYGGSDPSWAPSKTTYARFDNFAVHPGLRVRTAPGL